MVVVLSYAINQAVSFLSPVVDFLCQTVFLTFLLLLFGEIFPKLVARNNTVKWVKTAATPLSIIYRLTSLSQG